MAKAEPTLNASRNCWRIARADRAAVIIDAADYFKHARQAMLEAEQQVLLVGWDFDARIRLVHAGEDEAPIKVGQFFDWLVARRRALYIYLLRWDTGAIKSLFRGTTIVTLARWLTKRQIHLKLDSHHPLSAAHHQKIVVIDDCIAFCGGIDMTDERWDTRAHKDDERFRVGANGAPYKPWHDATTALTGPVAQALGELSRTRWHRAGGERLPTPHATRSCWPDGLRIDFEDCEVAISRTVAAMPGEKPVYEIETLYLDLIARAERWIYAESQYFASHKIAKAIAERLDEENGPEVVIINPVKAQGWLEPIAMDTARARLFEALQQRDRHKRLRIHHPVTRSGEPIYVHAKVMVVDGEILRVGSSNFNNRSMRLDSECDVTIDTTRPANAHCAEQVARVAFDLLAEHLDCDGSAVERRFAASGSLIETIAVLNRPDWRRLIDYEVPDLSAVGEALADNQLLDPENPGDLFEGMTGASLERGIGVVRQKPLTRPMIAAAAIGTAIGVGGLAMRLWRGRSKGR